MTALLNIEQTTFCRPTLS